MTEMLCEDDDAGIADRAKWFHFEAGVFGPEPFDISADMTYVVTVAP